jgi:uncharacterized protein (TIGR00369 family)
MKQRMALPTRVPFVEHLGLELTSAADGQAEVHVDIADAHFNAWDVAHGGVLMTMLDAAMAFATRSVLPESLSVATIEMKTSFMRPGEGTLRAVGKVVHRTTTMAFCEGSVHDDGGALCATASGTFKILRALPTRSGLAAAQKDQSPSAKEPPPAALPPPRPEGVGQSGNGPSLTQVHRKEHA